MPPAGVAKLPHAEILSYEELYRIACQAVRLGLEKIRITGGEPLVRKGIVGFIDKLAGIPGLKELVLTTNGVLLRDLAMDLRRAGLQRLNISLDSLQAEIFARITRGGRLDDVLEGIAAAELAGFPPPKINVVVLRGINDHEVADFAGLTLRTPYTVRFIEYMPTLRNPEWRALCVTGHEVLQRIGQHYSIQPVADTGCSGPARYFRIAGAAGTVGIVTPISNRFCDTCNRIRITAAGMARGCLFASDELDLKPFLRTGEDDALREAMRQIATRKPARHNLLIPQPAHAPFAMARIGG
jgi:cyclic pyranopterin phosphate synthase